VISGDPGWGAFGFAGGRYDPETGLVRFGARDYDPTTGRWTGKDPVRWDGKQANLLVYSGGDPVNFIDTTGRDAVLPFPWWIPPAAGAAVGSRVAGIPGALVGACIGLLFIPGDTPANDNAQPSRDVICAARAQAAYQLCIDSGKPDDVCDQARKIVWANCMRGL